MPLVKGKSKAAVAQNIKAEIAAGGGKKPRQAVAIALDTARKTGAKIPRKPKRSLGDMMDGA